MNTTAQVEVLTAEVRALMIGSRQVTLSVYRQLDWVEPENLEPFGRVNDAKESDYALQVVGRAAETGALVRARDRRLTTVARLTTAPPEFNEWYQRTREPSHANHETKWMQVASDGTLEVHYPTPRIRSTYPGYQWEEPVTATMLTDDELHELMMKRASDDLEWWTKRHALITGWQSLPLIVLAGLR